MCAKHPRRSTAEPKPKHKLCEHEFVTSQGSAGTRFQRSIEARNVFLAETAAFEMGSLSLENALQLVVLYAEARTTSSTRLPSGGWAG